MFYCNLRNALIAEDFDSRNHFNSRTGFCYQGRVGSWWETCLNNLSQCGITCILVAVILGKNHVSLLDQKQDIHETSPCLHLVNKQDTNG